MDRVTKSKLKSLLMISLMLFSWISIILIISDYQKIEFLDKYFGFLNRVFNDILHVFELGI
ncbi:MAG: hypothetical protein V5A68_06390 [Candidatus Thermoplasmatota archaeon]